MRIFVTVICCCFVLTAFGQHKAMTYNIRYDSKNDGDNRWIYRKAHLVEQIKSENPTVIGIQEGLHHQVQYLAESLTDYQYVGVGRDDGKEKGEYAAIFYDDSKVKLVESGTFWLSETPDKISVGWDAAMERICTYAKFKDNKGKQFWVFNAHFDHIGSKARQNSAELIIDKIKQLNTDELPVILMGDLNLKPTSDPIKWLSAQLEDSFQYQTAEVEGATGTYNGFKYGLTNDNRIDYIFVDKQSVNLMTYKVLRTAVDQRYPSDHFPVVVTFKMSK